MNPPIVRPADLSYVGSQIEVILRFSLVLIFEKPHSFLDDTNSLGMILRSARGAIGETEVTCDEQNVAIFTLPNEYGAC